MTPLICPTGPDLSHENKSKFRTHSLTVDISGSNGRILPKFYIHVDQNQGFLTNVKSSESNQWILSYPRLKFVYGFTAPPDRLITTATRQSYPLIVIYMY